MENFSFPTFFVPIVGLVFPAIAMASLYIHVKKRKKQDFLAPMGVKYENALFERP